MKFIIEHKYKQRLALSNKRKKKEKMVKKIKIMNNESYNYKYFIINKISF